MPWKSIKTQFVKDRMAETSWKDKKYIYDLALLERIIARGGPKNYNEARVYWSIHNRYPLEAECIEKEIEDEIYISPTEFQELEDKRRCEETIKAQQAERERKAKEDTDWKLWIKLGGRP